MSVPALFITHEFPIHGVSKAEVLDRSLEFMAEVADRMDGKLPKEPMLISKEVAEKME